MIAMHGDINWLAILVCVIIGQIYLTVWFAVIFADPWAKAYGAADKAQHTKEIPPYTYGIGLVCVILLVLGLNALQQAFGVTGIAGALGVGIFVAVHFCIATALPGYAFLRRWPAALMAIGSQASLILILSVVLALF